MTKTNKIRFTVFGHKGFLGSNIVNYLKSKDYHVYCPARNKVKFSKNLNNVIYCIGSDNVLQNPVNAINSNLFILSKILNSNKFKSFIYISSTRIYSNSNKTDELSNIKVDVNSKDYFFNTLKIAAENLCLSQNDKNIKVIRLSNLYGLNFSKQVYLLPTLIRNSIRKGKIDIFLNKKSKKNYLNVDDAIDIILKIIHKSKHRIYNVASDKRISLEFIAKTLKKFTKCHIIYSNQNKRYDEPVISINRIKKEFNFNPKNDFENMISKIIIKYK